jgi:hypothetical protein
MLRLSGGRAVRARCLALAAAVAAALAWPGSAGASSTDHPTASIATPSAGSVLPLGTPVIISGKAQNGEQGGIVLVEVSFDGSHWLPAALDHELWEYEFTPQAPGPVTIRVRASTTNTVQETPLSVTVYAGSGSVPPATCPCTFWMPDLPGSDYLDEQDSQPVEVGLRFRTDRDGYISGLYFRRNPENTGPQVAHLWSASGELLAEATLTGSTSSLPRITFNPPVPVQHGAGYVISYYTPTGHYGSSIGYFAGAVAQAPFEAIYDAQGTAGVYRYGGGFPDQTWWASNYWVSPIFTTTIATT